jgi:cell division FtsZ-interacting protein ZapD
LRQEKSELQKELDRKVAEVESLMRANSIDTKVNEQIIEHLYHKLALAKSKKLEKEYNDGEN